MFRSTASSPAARRSHNIRLGAGVFFSTLLLAEVLLRTFPALLPHHLGNLVSDHFRNLYAFDSRLGWTVKSHVQAEKWDVDIHTLADGIRSNGRAEDLGGVQGVPLLALGDSLTFGDEVADDATWPAQLEKKLSIPVLNAGVSSYGFDQMVLRAEQLVPLYRPRMVLVGFIHDDLNRSLQSVRHGVSKPYFEIADEELVLRNNPVPSPSERQAGSFIKILSRFQIGKLLIDRWGRKAIGTMHDNVGTNNPHPEETLRKLILRLIDLNRSYQAQTIFIYLESEDPSHVSVSLKVFLAELQKQHGSDVFFVDHGKLLNAILEKSSDDFLSLFNEKWNRHWNRKGHGLFAEHLEPLVRSQLKL